MLFLRSSISCRVLRLLSCLAVTLVCAQPAHANPYVNEGELKVNFNGSYTYDSDEDSGLDGVYDPELEVFYGLTDDLGLGFEATGERPHGETLGYKQTSVFVRYQLTDPETSWWVLALEAKLTVPNDRDRPYRAQGSILLQNDSYNMRHRAYITFAQRFGENAAGGVSTTLRWWSRYKLTSWFEPGVEYMGEFGELDALGNLDEKEHYLGPVLSGSIPILESLSGHKWEYEIGHLWGITEASAEAQMRWKFEIKVNF